MTNEERIKANADKGFILVASFDGWEIHKKLNEVGGWTYYSNQIGNEGSYPIWDTAIRSGEELQAIYDDIIKQQKDEFDLLSTPGDTIKETMYALGIDLPLFCLKIGFTPLDAQALLNGEMAITKAIAKKLQTIFNIDAQFWLNLETNYREKWNKLESLKNKPTND